MKNILGLCLCVGLLWATPQEKTKDLDVIAQSKYYKGYEKLTKDEKSDIDNIYRQKLLVLKLAKESDIEKSADYKEKVESAEKAILMRMYLTNKKESTKVSEKEIKAYYDKNIIDYTEVHAYTLVRKKKEDLDAYIKILNNTQKEKRLEVFKELCKKHSQHPRKSKGGDMGFVGYGTIVQPFGREAFKLKENEFTQKSFHTNLGHHLVYVSERKVRPYEKMKKNIESQLRSKKYKEWFMKL